MRRLAIAVLFILVASRAEAITLTPRDLGIAFDVLPPTFFSDTLCVNCTDADPVNDVRLQLAMPSFVSFLSAHYPGGGGGTLSTVGTTAITPLALAGGFHTAVRVTLWDFAVPWLRSTATGDLFTPFSGTFSASAITNDGFQAPEGAINGIEFRGASPFYEFEAPNGPHGGVAEWHWETEPPRFSQIDFQAVPEPSSLLLLGTGLLAWRRRR